MARTDIEAYELAWKGAYPQTSLSAPMAAATPPESWRMGPCVHGAPDTVGCVPCDQAAARAARRGRPAVEAERRVHVEAELELLDRVAAAERKLAIVEARERDTATLLESQRRTIEVQKENLAAQDARIRQMSAPSDRLYHERERGRRIADIERRRIGTIQLTREELEAARAGGVAFIKLAEAEVNAAVEEIADRAMHKLVQHPSGGFSFPTSKIEPVRYSPPGKEAGPSAVAGVKGLAPRHHVRRHTAVLYCQNEED
jgi:hypothetical protein